jgi:uncharacterized small protein (DUF1192 family)
LFFRRLRASTAWRDAMRLATAALFRRHDAADDGA